MKDASPREQRPLFGAKDLAQIGGLAGSVFDVTDQVDLLTRRRLEGMTLWASGALEEVEDTEGRPSGFPRDA